MNDLTAFEYGYLDIEFPGQGYPDIAMTIGALAIPNFFLMF